MLPRLRFFVLQALSGLWRSFGVTALSVVTIAVALALLATFAVVLNGLAKLADKLGQEAGVTVYLARATTDSAARARARELGGWSEVASAHYVTSTAAMASLRTQLGQDAEVLDGLPAHVLPPSIELRLAAQPWLPDELARLSARLGALQGVEDVRYGQEEIERVNALLRFARAAATVVGVALCLAAVLIVSNTIRLAVYARRDEIEVMSLFGATSTFVRVPFVLEGALEGLLGGVLAAAGLAIMREALKRGLEAGLSYAYGPIELEIVPAELLALLLLLGAALGLAGSALAVGKFIRV